MARSAASALRAAHSSYPERPGIDASAITRSVRVCRASVSPSSAERAEVSAKSSPVRVNAKAFWIVTLSSATRIRFPMAFWNITIGLDGQFAESGTTPTRRGFSVIFSILHRLRHERSPHTARRERRRLRAVARRLARHRARAPRGRRHEHLRTGQLRRPRGGVRAAGRGARAGRGRAPVAGGRAPHQRRQARRISDGRRGMLSAQGPGFLHALGEG